jgi:hypothetical protein
MRKRLWLGGLGALLLTAAGLLAYAYPSVASTTCPRCYGMVELQDRLFAERGLSGAEQQRLKDLYRAATERVAAFYGGRVSDPVVLACRTTACYDRIGGGGERGIAILNRAVMLSPRGTEDPVIAAHELSHVEVHERLGSRSDELPQWFDEGLAVLVSEDPRYLLPAGAADRCRVVPAGELPVTLAAWLRAGKTDGQLYAKAACRVSRWSGPNGGGRAVLDLIDRLNAGEPFTLT